MNPAALDALIAYYETLDPQSVGEMGRYYADDCYFKDPFNEVWRPHVAQHIHGLTLLRFVRCGGQSELPPRLLGGR